MITEIASPYVISMGNYQTIKFDKMPVEQRMKLDSLEEYAKSSDFKLDCIFKMFPQLLESGSVRRERHNYEKVTVFSDLVDIRTKKNYLDISGEVIECKEKMTENEYQLIFNNKMKEMIEDGKLTPEMIEDSKDFGNYEYYEDLTQNDNLSYGVETNQQGRIK